MIDWMAKLATHYAQMRQKYPDDQLMIIFDIDGTMLDLRPMMLHVLQGYDREHSTEYFRELTLNDINVHEYVIDTLLARFPLPAQAYTEIEQWYRARYWSSETIEVSHYAYAGVMDVVRWFQMQPHTHVALNTGRYEVLRADTLKSLNRLGQAHKVQFTDDQLFMRATEWIETLAARKIEGIRHFQAQGYRIFAFVENEPANLAAVASLQDDDILLLHPDTIYLSGLAELPAKVLQGTNYDLTEFLPETALPANLQLVWHGVNDPINLRQFLSSTIEWAELDVNVDPTGQTLILRHDTFAERPYVEGESWLTLEDGLAQAQRWGKAVKLDFKVGGVWIERTLAVLEKFGFANTQLWFNGELALLDEAWIRRLATIYPGAIIQIPIGFLRPLLSQPTSLRSQIDQYRAWGINRFSINWTQPEARQLFAHLTDWGCAVNFYGMPDLAAFLQAALYQPCSLTGDFNFPKWGYYGRGSGYQGFYHQYVLQTPITQ